MNRMVREDPQSCVGHRLRTSGANSNLHPSRAFAAAAGALHARTRSALPLAIHDLGAGAVLGRTPAARQARVCSDAGWGLPLEAWNTYMS